MHKQTVSSMRIFIPEGEFDPLVEKVTHKCRLCGSVVLHDNNYLPNHIVVTHKLKISDYYEKFVLDDDGDDDSTGDDESNKNKLQKTIKKERFENTSKSSSVVKTVSPLLNQPPSSHELDRMARWLNGVQFVCSVCSKSFFDRYTANKHLLHDHADVSSQDVKCTSRVTYHTCRMCSARFLQNKQQIKYHLSYTHGIDEIQDYFVKHILPEWRMRDAAFGKAGAKATEVVTIEELTLGDPTETDVIKWQKQNKLRCRICDKASRFCFDI